MVLPELRARKIDGTDSQESVILGQERFFTRCQLIRGQIVGTVGRQIVKSRTQVSVKCPRGCSDLLAMDSFMGQHLVYKTEIGISETCETRTDIRLSAQIRKKRVSPPDKIGSV